MYKGITLNEFIAELQLLAADHGEKEISSIGSSSGKILGMSNPFCFNFKGHDVTEFVPAFQADVRALPEQDKGERIKGTVEEFSSSSNSKTILDKELRHVWARVGMTLDITPAEEKAIFEGDYFTGKEAVMRVIEAGRASVDGETYIPEECIEDFDQEYGTNYRDREEECAWTLDGQRVAALSLDVQKQAIVADVLFDAKARAGEPVVRRDEKEFTLD